MTLQPIEPDLLYHLDFAFARLVSGRSGISTSGLMAESIGVSKTQLHFGMVGVGAVPVAAKVLAGSAGVLGKVAGIAAIAVIAFGVFAYLEAPRTRHAR